ncbi:hypothetical protein MES5069_70308 [Mesorhizobium escarrei]|uniref:Uncharacterized protein n=1 Tax=Mesorhizobium escarrei TaxID=666018 RepID=A0ABN8KEL7_9HYPH|nr:hypothetical protein MES5069_70308 [Mesorhizobium escarrei]
MQKSPSTTAGTKQEQSNCGRQRGVPEHGFIPAWVPCHECGERWLGEAETERGTALYEGPLSGRFAATSPRFAVGEEPKS